MKYLHCCLLLLAFSSVNLPAQDIVQNLQYIVPGQGRVTIYEDADVKALLTTHTEIGARDVMKGSGYRVQIYAGNNSRQAHSEALEVASRIKMYFPDLEIDTSFISPRWLCRVGDFRSIEEANVMMRKIKAVHVFKEVSIAKDEINIKL